MAADPEVRELSLAYARAVAITERLAHELDETVNDLIDHLHKNDPVPVVEAPKPLKEAPRARAQRRRTTP